MRAPKYDFSKDNEYNTFGKDNFRNANTGEEVRMVTEDWRSLSQKGGLSYADTKIDPESTWAKYIQYLPEIMLLDYLTKEQWGDQDLIDKSYGKPYLVNRINLCSLPEETLKLLLSRYHESPL